MRTTPRGRQGARDAGAPATPAPEGVGVASFARELAIRAARAEADAARLSARLEEIQRFLRHDARTPLAVVLGHAQMLAEGIVPESRRGESFEVVSRQIRGLGARMDRLGARAGDAPVDAAVWVCCAEGEIPAVRAALAGLPVVVGTERQVRAICVDGDRVVVVGSDWSADALRGRICGRTGETTG